MQTPEAARTKAPRLGVLLVNSGTPDTLDARGVRDFLRRLLSDPRTIETPRAIWNPILYGIILPLRPARVLPKYRRVWTKQGSPLQVHSQALRERLRGAMGDALVELGMLYSTPDVARGLATLRDAGAQRIRVLPLFPQYSGTTTAAVADQVGAALRTWRVVPEITLLGDYAEQPLYIDALAQTVIAHRERNGAGEHLLISFHGIPAAYVENGDTYLSRCQATSRLLAQRLGLAEGSWSMCFQSRVGRAEWLKPYTFARVEELARQGVSRLDVICPGFAVDCLETIDEIGHEAAEEFRKAGGKELRYIPALNAGPGQVELLASLLRQA